MRVKVAARGELTGRMTRKFRFQRGEETLTGVLVHHDGTTAAYLNRCRHLPWPLDWEDGAFYSRDRDWLVCHTHGALYEPATGLCVAGPCAGQSLEALAVVLAGDDVFVEV